MPGERQVQQAFSPPQIPSGKFNGVSVMLVQRLGIIFVIFVAFALSFGSFVNYAKSSRAGYYQNSLMHVTN
jgi:hypothetical protein